LTTRPHCRCTWTT